MTNEFNTRKIIDEQLRSVGWEADTENLRYSNGTRPQKGHNIAIAEWQTDSGFVDYALFIGTKMIATIEAKASYKDVSAVIDFQCKDYARNIRDEDKSYLLGDWRGFKVPFTFATNGRPYCQHLESRILFLVDRIPGVTDYDLIIIDEAHRGYILDRELADDEILFKDQSDYQSKYRAVIDYFDAVKIALTATPALHTTEIFGKPVFKYTYREAVIDGYLVDHDLPHCLKTKLSEDGIYYTRGESVTTCDSATGELVSEFLADELDFDIDNFNRQVVNENFNRVVLEEISNYIDPEGSGKTLIFAVNDMHADLIVHILKNIYIARGISNDAITKITGSIGDKERVLDAIRRLKNERYPNIVVTVDLLTTGIDVPAIDTLVFMRRVKSRILFEQMLGRATRLCPDIGKTHFRIFDAVGIYDALEPVSEMKPVVANSSVTFTQLFDTLKNLDDDKAVQNLVNQIIVKLRRCKTNEQIKDIIDILKNLSAQDVCHLQARRFFDST